MMYDFKAWLKKFIFGEDESGFIHLVAPDGDLEVKVKFNDDEDGARRMETIKTIIDNEIDIRCPKIVNATERS